MRAGRLRHRLVIQSKSEARDAFGGVIITWADVATVYGAIEPLSGKELFRQFQVQAEAKVRIVIRYRSDVNTTCRITNDGKYYDIVSVINHDERNRMLTIMCREGVSEDVGGDADEFWVVNGGTYVVNSGTQVVST